METGTRPGVEMREEIGAMASDVHLCHEFSSLGKWRVDSKI